MVNCSSLTHFIFKLLHNYHFVSLFELFHLFFQTKNICLRFESFVAWLFWYFYIFISFIFYCCTKCCNILIVDNLKSYKTADVVLPIILIIQNNYRLQTMIHSTNSFLPPFSMLHTLSILHKKLFGWCGVILFIGFCHQLILLVGYRIPETFFLVDEHIIFKWPLQNLVWCYGEWSQILKY